MVLPMIYWCKSVLRIKNMGRPYNLVGFGAEVVLCTYGHLSKKADFWDSGFGIKYVGGRRKTDHLFLLGVRR